MVDKVESIFELWKDNDDVEYDCDDASINSHIYASTCSTVWFNKNQCKDQTTRIITTLQHSNILI